MEPNSTSPNPNPFAVLLTPVGPFGGRAFLEAESLAGHLVLSLQPHSPLLQSADDHNAPSLLSPGFQTLVRPQFYIAAIEILKKLAQDVDEESKASLRAFVWAHLFTIVGNQTHSGDQVIEEAAQKAGQSLIDIEVLFISFLLATRSYPHYFGPGAVVDHIPTGVFLTQVVEKNVQDFFQVLRQVAATKQAPLIPSNSNSNSYNSNQMDISTNFPSNNSPSNGSNSGFGASSRSSGQGSFSYNTGTPPTTPTQAPAQSPFSSFMIIPQADGPVFQKFRRSEFNEMTFVTSQQVPERKPLKKEEPKSLQELMGSFRIDEWKEWKDETPLATKNNYSSSLARSMKRSRKGSGSAVEASGSNSSSPRNHSPSRTTSPKPQLPPPQPGNFQFEFNVNAPQSMPMDIVSPQHSSSGFGSNTFASSESPRSSGTHSPTESPRNPFLTQMGLPSSQNVLRPQVPTLYHSAAPAGYMNIAPMAPRPAPQGLSQSDPSGRKRSSSRKSAFREITPGSFSKPVLIQQPEILSLGIHTNTNTTSGTPSPLSDSRIQVLTGSQASSRGRSMSAKNPLSKSSRGGGHVRSQSTDGFALIAEQSLDNSEAMDIDPAS